MTATNRTTVLHVGTSTVRVLKKKLRFVFSTLLSFLICYQVYWTVYVTFFSSSFFSFTGKSMVV